jgi:hypothetical protein
VSTIPLRLCASARVKNKKRIWLPAILRGRLQSRQAAKASGRNTERPQFLCNCLPQAGLCEKKKRKNKARKAAKAQRPPEEIPSDHNLFAPASRSRAMREEKIKKSIAK